MTSNSSGRLIGLMVDSTPQLLLGMLGILKSGNGFVPIDPRYPEERISFIIADCELEILIVQEKYLDQALRAADQLKQIICLDAVSQVTNGNFPVTVYDRQDFTARPSLVQTDSRPDKPAYVIYTSGSTGKPKGVPITHSNLAPILLWGCDYFKLGLHTKTLQVLSYCFDFGVFDLLTTLLAGGTVHFYDRTEITGSFRYSELINSRAINTLHCTPSSFKEMMRSGERMESLKTLHLGGEQLTRNAIEQLSEALGDDCVIYNGYGPTEASVNCAIFSIGTVAAAREHQVDHVPIGRVTANNTLYILDQEFEPVPVGVYGEVYVGGAGLTSGYLRRPELTAALFSPHPFGKQAGERLYRTGDIGRYLADGNIECRGRIDHQVKVRGFRVEPGEVEAVLVQHPRVSAAAVDAQADGAGNLRLVAFLIPDVMPGPSTEELRGFMKQRLPQHMVPSIFVALDQLPLNPNGKLDRKALPAPELSGREQESAGLRTPVEELLAGIFAEVLKLGRVGRDENFFELGGHSLLATQVVSRVQLAFAIELPLRTLFEAPTVAALAHRIEEMRVAGQQLSVPPIQAVQRGEELPLSFAQQRLWFIDQLEPESAAYNIPAAVRLRGKLNVEALRRSFAEIVRRHEVLRTRFVTEAGEPQQVIGAGWEVELPVLKLSEAAAREWAAREAAQPFVLSEGPLLRLGLARLSEEEHVLAVTMHHIISDGWSVGVLIREVSALYEAYSRGEESPLAELAVQYGDFAVWQREWLQGAVLEQQLNYWREQLAGLVPLELPTDRPRPAVSSHAGAVVSFELNAELTAQLKALTRCNGVTPFMTLLTGFQLLLSKYSNQSDIAVGTDVANRNRAETEGLIGFFVNQLVLRSEVKNEQSFSELLKQVRETTLGAYEHQDLPFERLVESLMPERDLSRTPLFQVKLVMQNAPREQMQLIDLELTSLAVETQQTKFDLTLFLEEQNERIAGKLEYACDLFDAVTVERLLAHWRIILNSVATARQSRLSEITWLEDSEIQQLLLNGTGPGASLDETTSLPNLISERARIHPHRIALEEFDRQLTYQALNERANQLAHYLEELGVTSGATVVICMKRSLELVIGLLGVLKAGAAYLTLDPNDPAERRAYIIDETQAPLVLTQESLAETLPSTLAHMICLDSDWETIASCDKADPGVSVFGEQLAYVIYTSGSTGKPKGVMVTHTGFANYVHWSRAAYNVESGNGSPVHSSLSFDLSVTSLWTTLAGGARVQLFAEGAEADQLGAEIEARRGYSLIKLTPTHLHVLEQIVGDEQVQSAAGALVIGGEALRYEHLRDWRQRMPGCRFINEYGPTETVVGSCVYEVADDCTATGEVPIGLPIANTEVYVIDEAQQLLPVGVYGELCIGGVGLARGYLNRPELTAERFVPQPYSTTGGARVYRTGDVVRWNAQGQLEFRGRADHQVKVHGYRIELGEIEAALRSCGGVKQAVVLAREQRLVGYVVSDRIVSSSELRTRLSEKLPPYMVPAVIVELEALPLTANGKLDRNALPDPELSSREQEHAGPRTPVEELLAGIFAEVLKLERVSINDNFFALGGDSILAISIVSKARRAGLQLSVQELFLHQNVSALAQVCGSVATVPIAAEPEPGPVLFTPIQHWFFSQQHARPEHFNQSVLLKLKRAVPASVLAQALSKLLAHHDALRMRFTFAGEQWRQHYGEQDAAEVFTHTDFSDLTNAEARRRLEQQAEQLQRSLNLQSGPLLRLASFAMAGETQRLLLIVHHLVIDAVSWRILLEDLETCCRQLMRGEVIELPPKTSSMQHWANALEQHRESDRFAEQTLYWLTQARETQPGKLPRDNEQGENLHGSVKQEWIEFSAADTQMLLQEIPGQDGTQIQDVLVHSLLEALYEWSGQPEWIIELEGHGRDDEVRAVDVTRTIGWFTTIYPVRLRRQTGAELETRLKDVREQLREVKDKDLAYGLLRYQVLNEVLQNLDTTEVIFNYLGQFDQVLGTADGLFRIAPENAGPNQDATNKRPNLLEIVGVVSEGRLKVSWNYSAAVHREETIKSLVKRFEAAIREVIESRTSGFEAEIEIDADLSHLELETILVKVGAIQSS